MGIYYIDFFLLLLYFSLDITCLSLSMHLKSSLKLSCLSIILFCTFSDLTPSP